MLTIFTCLKSFSDPLIATIQRNALTSWTFLSPRPEIIVFGDHQGVPEIAKGLGITYIKGVKTNPADGRELMSDAFAKAGKRGKHDLMMYCNADIIMPINFLDVVQSIDCLNYLMIGERWNTDLAHAINFQNPNWWVETQAYARDHGRGAGVVSVDYFVHKRGAFGELPVMSSGGFYTDNWIVNRALDLNLPVIDASQVVMAIHQNHGGLSIGERHELPEAVALKASLTRGAVNLAHVTHRLLKPN
jgi:hypothetical protein